jgi:uncharacterized YkwD family protein
LIVALLVPGFVGIFGTSNLYASSGFDEKKIKDDLYSVLKGLAMLFVLGKLVDLSDSSSDEQSSQPTSNPSEANEESGNASDNDSSIVTKKPPINDDKQTSNNDWTKQEVISLTVAEKEMSELLNSERKKRGLEPLKVDLRLVKVARAKSQDMIENNYFDHESPRYGLPFAMMKEINIYYTLAGENIAGASTVERAHRALMNSQGHRENILRPRFTHVGIGIVEGGPYGMMFSQEFIDKS